MKTDKYWKKRKRKKKGVYKKEREREREKKEKNMKKTFNVRLICLSLLVLRYLLVGVPVLLFRGKMPIEHPLSFT